LVASSQTRRAHRQSPQVVPAEFLTHFQKDTPGHIFFEKLHWLVFVLSFFSISSCCTSRILVL
jgi:hypothetical protein